MTLPRNWVDNEGDILDSHFYNILYDFCILVISSLHTLVLFIFLSTNICDAIPHLAGVCIHSVSATPREPTTNFWHHPKYCEFFVFLKEVKKYTDLPLNFVV